MAARNQADGIDVWCVFDEIVPLDELRPRDDNPNRHPPEQINLLSKIIREQGWRAPITVSNRSGLITRGHGRLMAAQHTGAAAAPVEYQDYDSDESEWADVIADNKISEYSELDQDAVKEILAGLDFSEFDLDLTGFDVEQISSADNSEGDDTEGAGNSEGDDTEYIILIKTEDENMQKNIFEEMRKRGIDCKVIVS